MVLRILVALFVCLNAEAQPLPMRPFFSAKTNEFLGLVIEGDSGQPAYNQGASKRLVFSTVAMSSSQKAAISQLRSLGLYTAIINGTVIGTKKQYSAISFERTKTVGLSLNFDFSGDDVLKLGSQTFYGFNLDWSRVSAGDLREKNGAWLTDPITSVVQNVQLLSQRKSALAVTEEVLELATMSASLEERRNTSDWPEESFPSLKRARMSEIQVSSSPVSESLETPSKWKTVLQDFQIPKSLAREQRWQAFVKPINDQAPLWDNQDAQNYIQTLCDQLALRTELKPRCRVFASLKPFAFSYPGGDIFVTTGLLNVISNEATLVFFLSHEMAHVYARHFTKNLDRKDYQASFMNTLALATSVVAFKPPESRDLKKLSSLLGVQKYYAGMMTNYTKDNELEADEMGLELALSLGYSKDDIVAGLENLGATIERDFTTSRSSLLESRYPSWNERLQRLEKSETNTSGTPNNSVMAAQPNLLSNLQKATRAPFQFYRLNHAMETVE